MGALIFIGVVTIAGILFIIWLTKGKFPLFAIISMCLFVAATGGYIAAKYSNTASFTRSIHDIKSEFSNGVYRELKVYSVTGELITSTKGTFDVEYVDGRVKYIDEKGLSHLIYAGSGATVMVDDIEQPETSK